MSSLAEAVRAAMWDEMEANPNTLLIGEAITSRGGASKLTYDFEDSFGGARVVETPISENALVGGAFGAALAGTRVMCEVYSADFLFCAGSEVFNDLAKWRYEHQYDRPIHLLIRAPTGSAGAHSGPEHSQSVEGYLHHAPGIRVLVPSDAQTAYDGLRAGLASGDPVILLEHRALYRAELGTLDRRSPVEGAWPKGRICREGVDITVVAWGRMQSIVQQAAAVLSERAVSMEVIDPVSVKPLDLDLVAASAARTGRLLVVEESPRTGSIAGEIIASMVDMAPIGRVRMRRLTMPDVHHPYHSSLEWAVLPSVDAVIEEVVALLNLSN